jgi:DNA-binding NarL/FixJ family response regulator
MVDLIPVMVIDDQLVQREGIAKLVEATGNMRVIGLADNFEEAIRIIRRERVELALIDFVLEERNGIETGRKLRDLCSWLKIVIYTREKSMVLASEIFREHKQYTKSGLQGYLLTRNISSSAYLLKVYDKIIENGYFIDSDVLRWYYQFSKFEKLTPREEECAHMIVKGLSNSQIADRMAVSRRRVENLINSLYQKFNIYGDKGDPARRVILAESIQLLVSSSYTNQEIGIVIVEDQQVQRFQLCEALSKDKRFKVLEAVADGESGIEAVFHTRPDVVIVDINLPDMNGFEVTQRILEAYHHAKVILTSSEESILYERLAIEAGAVAFIPKVFLSPDRIFKASDSSER